MDSPYNRELAVAICAVKEAARLSLAVLPDPDKGALEKGTDDDGLGGPVTVGDFAIQALLTATLHAAFPGDAFVGEEDARALRANPALCARVYGLARGAAERVATELAGAVDGGSGAEGLGLESAAAMCDTIDRCLGAPSTGRVWVFDPIDGTKTFVRREMYAINVGLLVDGRQTVGVVACPLLLPDDGGEDAGDVTVDNASVDATGRGSLLFAVRGHGAFVRPLFAKSGSQAATTAAPRRLQSMTAATTDADVKQAGTTDRLRLVTSHMLQDSALEDVHRAVAARLGMAYPGSDLLGWVPRWAVLARGVATGGRFGGNTTFWVYKRRGRYAKVWDHAGAMLLYEEAGGKITDVDGRAIDPLGGRQLRSNYGFVAAPATAHHEVLAAVRAVLQEQGRADLLHTEGTVPS